MKQMEVTIMGQSYILACPDGREVELLEAVAGVDREMCGIRDAGKVKARERIAVLAALNLAYALAEQARAPAPQGNVHTTPPVATSRIDLDALVHRVDVALSDDGQLL